LGIPVETHTGIMARLEYKYRVPYELKDSLRADMLPYLKHDNFSAKMPDKEYTVRSVYYDTPALSSYYEKLSGIRIRNKFRIRGYNELTGDSHVFVEIKRRDTNYISKDRALMPYAELGKFLQNSDLTRVTNHSLEYEKRLASARNFLYHMLHDRLQPVINVVYEREAFECKFSSGLRVTFDLNIRSRITNTYENLFEEDQMESLFSKEFVLEIKYGTILPSWVPAVINKYELRKESVSKYCLSLELHMKNKVFFNPY
jgi:SPX domain protein involved in polyphosphate accumulation